LTAFLELAAASRAVSPLVSQHGCENCATLAEGIKAVKA